MEPDSAMIMELPQTMNIFVRLVPAMGFSSDMWPGPGGVYFFVVFYPSATLLYWYKGEWRTMKRAEFLEE